MQDTLQRGKETYSPHLLTLLENRLDTCRDILIELQASLAGLSPALTPVHERLVSILRSISAANTRQKVSFSFPCRLEIADHRSSFRQQKLRASENS